MSLVPPGLQFPKPADDAMAARGLADWLAAAKAAEPETRAFAESLADSPEGRHLILSVCGNSPYLGNSLVRDLDFVRGLLRDGFEATQTASLAELRRRYAGETDTDRLMAGLRLAKRRAALLIALADIGGAWSLASVTGALSDMAECALDLAANHLLRRAATAKLLHLPDLERPLLGSGLIILAMGKFGARELNYSSDIDLILFYDDEVAKAPPDSMARTFIRLARDLVRIMDERTRDGYVFRTDLRLRPDPGATPLAVSVTAAETYYAGVGQNWERAALIKARPVASDPEPAARFLEFLKPFIWRRNLDFAAIQDIHSIKRQIHAHKGHHRPAVNGHDIKLGRGGIREIEFFAQTQQLIFGGREARLRLSPTCAALEALVAAGRVAPMTAVELKAAYFFLRQVEHRLQMIDDRQTHQLPKTDEGVEKLSVFLGYDTPAAFRDMLLGHLVRVEEHYADLFEEAPPLAGPGNLVFTGTDPDPGTVETLGRLGFSNPSAVIATVAAWHHGRYRAMRSARARELLTELTPTLLQELGRTRHPDEALGRLDMLLSRLPAGIPLFSLFHANPWLLGIIAEVMGTAPRLAQSLAAHPALLEAVLAPDFFDPLPQATALADAYRHAVAPARHFEEALSLSRRWVHDQIFRAGVHILRNITDGDHCGPFLSAVADIALADLLERVTEDFARRHGRIAGGSIAIIAMGKLGSGQMTIGSDLDLILVYHVPPDVSQSDGAKPLSPSEYAIKLTQRLIHVITAPTPEGRLYEVDMRLRPSGHAGPVAVSLEAFTRYHRDEAWTWEHMALTRARLVAGSPWLCEQLRRIIHDVLTHPRDPVRLVMDVADMRRRIQKEFATKNPWEIKYMRGGFIDINFIAQYLMLRHAHDYPQVISANTVEALDKLASAGVLARDLADDLMTIHRTWRRIQGFLRLTTGGGFEPNDAPLALRLALARCVWPESGQPQKAPPDSQPDTLAPVDFKDPIDFKDVDAHVRDSAARAFQYLQMLIDEPAEREHLALARSAPEQPPRKGASL